MSILGIKVRFFFRCMKKQIKGWANQLGCYFHSSWYFIKSDCLCTTGQVVKLNHIYTYEDNEQIDIVRLTGVHFERSYLFCSLFFFSKNQIVTVRHTLLKGTQVAWRLLDNKEYDELMSMRLWQEVIKEEELLEFDF